MERGNMVPAVLQHLQPLHWKMLEMIGAGGEGALYACCIPLFCCETLRVILCDNIRHQRSVNVHDHSAFQQEVLYGAHCTRWRCGPLTWQQKPFTFSVFDNHSHSVFWGIFILSPTTYKILHLHSNTHMHQLWAGFCFLATFQWTRALLCCVLQTHMCRSEAKTQQKKVRWSGLPYGRRPIETVAYVCVCWYVPLTMTTESCEILAFVFAWLVSVSAVQS